MNLSEKVALRLLSNLDTEKAHNIAIRDLKLLTKKKDAQKKLPTVISMIDKLSKTNIIHTNKAANLKSKLSKFVDSL